MCTEAKTNRASLVSPDLNTIEVLVTHPGSFCATSESSTASGCSPLSMGVDSQERLRRHMLLVRPRYEAVISAEECHTCFLTNLTQVN